MTHIKCHLCGNVPPRVSVVLIRARQFGDPGVWECQPSCSPKDDAPVLKKPKKVRNTKSDNA